MKNRHRKAAVFLLAALLGVNSISCGPSGALPVREAREASEAPEMRARAQRLPKRRIRPGDAAGEGGTADEQQAGEGGAGAPAGTSGGGRNPAGGSAVSYTITGRESVRRLLTAAVSKLGSPYVWGGKGPDDFDCSGFVYWCLNQAGADQSYMTSAGWANSGRGRRISSFGELRAGDIIVVSGHVGICAGGGTVIDASSSSGRVVYRPLSSWWQRNFICGWRIF